MAKQHLIRTLLLMTYSYNSIIVTFFMFDMYIVGGLFDFSSYIFKKIQPNTFRN